MDNHAKIQPIARQFIPKDFFVTDWQRLEPYFVELKERPISSLKDLKQWMQDGSELEAVLSEDVCWRQIAVTRDTEEAVLAERFSYFMSELQPKIQPYSDALNKKLIGSEFAAQLKEPEYYPYLRTVKKNIDLFREANIPLQSEIAISAQQFGVISGKMLVTIGGKEYTLQQAAKFLENPDRKVREEVYKKIADRRLQSHEELTHLFDALLQKRHQIAINAGFENYRDYRFAELGRFDYTKEDCFQFHEGVKQYVLPLVNEIYKKKKEKLGVEVLKPWDLEAEPEGIKPLRPFVAGIELLEKAITCFNRVDPFFADCLLTMQSMDRFDLDSRKGKAPGGYNCPLAETGAPFIFMNAAGTFNDVVTMVHEGGHAIHSFLSHSLPLTGFKEYPTEIAEVASMSMELFSMDDWDVFFKNEEDLKRAKTQQLERVITLFPWIATVDKFQNWLYENPIHTHGERQQKWMEIQQEFTPGVLNVSDLEHYRAYSWQRQLHIFEVPFYYIEYGIAQLGAIGFWQQYKRDKEQAIADYKKALSLGGTRTLPELFAAAGLQFDFSPVYIKELVEFVQGEIGALADF